MMASLWDRNGWPEAGLLFFDTASTYFDTDGEDEPAWRDKHGVLIPGGDGGGDGGKLAGFRALGKSKNHSDDLPLGTTFSSVPG
ncbi:MAG TPA: hypothetical protein VH307_11340 [Streptosporangiaceae bacterium]|jgi:hypothetical protein|nr:hypothetical protein [Streptosporangiaceae bacterium]